MKLSRRMLNIMKKIFLFCIIVCLCSCSTVKLANTVWYNVTPAELYGRKCNVITSLYFWDAKTMNFNTCIMQDTTVLVPTIMTANGSYSAKGNLKKGVKVQLNVKNIQNKEEKYYGLIKEKGMVLISPDSIAKAYNLVTNATLKQEKK